MALATHALLKANVKLPVARNCKIDYNGKNKSFSGTGCLSLEILIEKAARRLTLFICGRKALIFPIVLGSCPEGKKTREGDGRTPEGRYYVCTHNEKSKYHLSLGLSYPGPEDADGALARGEITPTQYDAILSAHASSLRPPWDTPLGGFIMIHGGGTEGDWTAGCIALDNADMEQLFALCRLKTPVTIVP